MITSVFWKIHRCVCVYECVYMGVFCVCFHVCAGVEVLRRKNGKEVLYFITVVIYWRRRECTQIIQSS